MLTAYLIFSIVLAAAVFVYLLYEDLVTGPDHKFGANFYNRRTGIVVNGLSIGMVVLFLIPVINIIWLGFWMYMYWWDYQYNIKKAHK